MNSEPENFETLRQLMALKRHEQPPPEYLEKLSDRIITRIEHGEGQLNFWDKLSANFSLRPSLAYAFGLTICGALGLSSFYLVRQEMADTTEAASGMTLRGPVHAAMLASQLQQTTPPLHVANWIANTNPGELQTELSLFDSSHAIIPVNYTPGR